jgi:nucleoside 2-deoxyribosyltransferase
MKAYISISYSKRLAFEAEVNTIRKVLETHRVESFIFVDYFKFVNGQERQMMKEALKRLDECDLLIAETSDKAIGIGVEACYAKAKGIPVIYLRREDAEHSTTVAGISDVQIIYHDINDLSDQLHRTIRTIRME